MLAAIWQHPLFRSAQPEYRAFTLYVLTGPQATHRGIGLFSMPVAGDDLKTGPNDVDACLAWAASAWKWQYDAASRVLWVPQYFAWFPPANERAFRKALDGFHALPDSPLKAKFLAYRKHVPEPFWPVLDALGQGIPPSKRVVSLQQEAEVSLFGDKTPRLVVDNDLAAEVVALWNRTVTEPLPKARLTPGLARKIRARWKENPSLAVFERVFQAVNVEPYCRGESDNDQFRDYRADIRHPLRSPDKFEWFIARAQQMPARRVAVGSGDVVGCRHRPPCSSLAACTDRRMNE